MSGAVPAVPADVGESAMGALTWKKIVDAKAGIRLASAIRNPLLAAYDTLHDTFTAVVTAHADVSKLEMDTRLDRKVRLSEQSALMAKAYPAARAAVPALRAAQKRALDQLTTAVLPKEPAGADSVMAALAAGELIRYLETADGYNALLKRAAGVLGDALRTDDALSAFLVTGSAPLKRFYQRIGVDQGSLFQEFQRVMAEVSGSDPTATTVDVNTARPGGLDPSCRCCKAGRRWASWTLAARRWRAMKRTQRTTSPSWAGRGS
jgi:hypothetical protein